MILMHIHIWERLNQTTILKRHSHEEPSKYLMSGTTLLSHYLAQPKHAYSFTDLCICSFIKLIWNTYCHMCQTLRTGDTVLSKKQTRTLLSGISLSTGAYRWEWNDRVNEDITLNSNTVSKVMRRSWHI